MADREQTRRDAEQRIREYLDNEANDWRNGDAQFAADVLALLAELEQAEREAESVPALGEALREWDERTAAAFDALHLWDLHDRTTTLLTVYEQSQGKP